MQKKHLRALLLMACLAGCRGKLPPVDNAYLFGNQELRLSIPAATAPMISFRRTDLRISRFEVPTVALRVAPHGNETWTLEWQDERGEPVRISRRIVTRSLLSVSVADTADGFTLQVCPLPDGQGAAIFLSGFPSIVCHAVLTAPGSLLSGRGGTVFHLAPPIALATLSDSSALAIASPALQSIKAIGTTAWRLELKSAETRQLLLSFGRDRSAARRSAEACLGLSCDVIETAVRDALLPQLAFHLGTEDDRTNRAFALLAISTYRADERLPLSSRRQIEDAAQVARAGWLTSRELPLLTVAADSSAATLGRLTARDDFRWGSTAYEAALDYGMVDDSRLTEVQRFALAELAALHGEYTSENLEALVDEGISDSLMRLAVAHVRMAALMTLGEKICASRGDHDARNSFRRDAQWAAKRARQFFAKSATEYASYLRTLRPVRLESLLDTSDVADSDGEFREAVGTKPDTLLFLSAGARYGFNWLADNPSSLWKNVPASDGFTWQRWVDARFRQDLKITETVDFDSLLGLILDGPAPGMLTTSPGNDAEPSVLTMSAALQNLAELYLGVRPDGMQRRVTIEPRLPNRWGRTVARLPLRDGVLHLDYDFASQQAHVQVSAIPYAIEVYFGYPLSDGGFARTQFTLTPKKPSAHVRMERDKENRVRLFVKEE